VIDPVEYLDLDDLIDLAGMLLGDPFPVRDAGLLGSAAARPQMSVVVRGLPGPVDPRRRCC
jgi:hypothetical protein